MELNKIVKSFEGSQVRMLSKQGNFVFSLYDVSKAIGFSVENNEYRFKSLEVAIRLGELQQSNLIKWNDSERLVFINTDYIIELVRDKGDDKAFNFLKWIFRLISHKETTKVNHPKIRNDYNESSDNQIYFAITQISKKYGMSGKRLNKILNDLDIQYKVNGQWVLYEEHQDKGFTKDVKIRKYNGEEGVHTYWTLAGKKFIEELLSSVGISDYSDTDIKQLSLF